MPTFFPISSAPRVVGEAKAIITAAQDRSASVATDVSNLNFDLIRDTAIAAGIPMTEDFSGAQPEGFGIVDLTIKNGVRSSASAVYLRPALKRANLTVKIGALTERILIEKGRATGVTYVVEWQARYRSREA